MVRGVVVWATVLAAFGVGGSTAAATPIIQSPCQPEFGCQVTTEGFGMLVDQTGCDIEGDCVAAVFTLQITCPTPSADAAPPEIDYALLQPGGRFGGGTPEADHLRICDGSPHTYRAFAVTEGFASTLHPGLAMLSGHIFEVVEQDGELVALNYSFDTEVILLPTRFVAQPAK
jgi:hypothetical protein